MKFILKAVVAAIAVTSINGCTNLNFEGGITGAATFEDEGPKANVTAHGSFGNTHSETGTSSKVSGTVGIDETGDVNLGVEFEFTFGQKTKTENSCDDANIQADTKLTPHQKEMLKLVTGVACEANIDPLDFVGMGWIESRLIATAASPYSSAKGLYQFINSTAKVFSLEYPFDPLQNAQAAARLWLQNKAAFEVRFGHAPEGWQLYAMHQQGQSGAIKLFAAGDALARSVTSRSAIVNNGGAADMSADAFMNLWKAKFARSRNIFSLG